MQSLQRLNHCPLRSFEKRTLIPHSPEKTAKRALKQMSYNKMKKCCAISPLRQWKHQSEKLTGKCKTYAKLKMIFM